MAYSPLLALKESHVATYKIYKLIKPDTNEIFYVGQTIADLETRLYGHLAQSESNKPKVEYIQKLLSQGKKPIIKELEAIHATCYIDKHFVNERERYWIKYHKSIGCTLLNIAISGENSKSDMYHMYLSSIKQGQTSYQYYYCGKTYGDVAVYDAKKLEADGFKFTPYEDGFEREKYLTENDGDPYPQYSPWNNPRFLKKAGYLRDISDHLSYIPCYKDTDPAYYDDDCDESYY